MPIFKIFLSLFLSLYPFRDALFLLCKNIIFFFASDPLVNTKTKNQVLKNTLHNNLTSSRDVIKNIVNLT